MRAYRRSTARSYALRLVRREISASGRSPVRSPENHPALPIHTVVYISRPVNMRLVYTAFTTVPLTKDVSQPRSTDLSRRGRARM
jgi:hypothetical protein